MHTKQSLMDDLYRMHAPQNLPVIVHTSLKKIGACEDGAEGVLSVLIDYFTKDGGLLIIPTHTWRNLSHPSAYTLDMTPVGQAEVRACIGVLPSVAAYHPLAHRSRHPTHSVAVFDGTPAGTPGRAEDYIRRDDRECGSSTHPDGCFGSLYAQGGKVLLLGVGQQNDTFLHAIEEIVGVPGRLMEEARVSLRRRVRQVPEIRARLPVPWRHRGWYVRRRENAAVRRAAHDTDHSSDQRTRWRQRSPAR